ncbi:MULTISPECIES: GbsR/MarR family transcriptional regulator [Streptosporangium]|uniref:DNA-binding transcriptional regulator GbsR (MarR family) n=1 Tax=Streptosporangium brasiliense TaxID=47480 RepID=A0ABT9RGL3_9ACTN|nr:MarR family transcriptional regulator [Streptosporangium brasiliense]MDP9868428.1 DNA-binding transcriptional regulator GbsR (MarR family) [Streptosporangium brasiliense]
MPGGRLTHQERRQIAEGLAERLTYTEIAGRLGRPISTITREVTRNGGPGGYRADQAHRATEGRARRRKPAPVPGPPALTDAHGRDPEAVRDLEERFTAMMIGTGLPRMTARVLTCLYTTDSGSLTAAELVQRLQVSPASISKAIGELEQQELIRRERDPHRRRDRYVIDADAWFRGWMASARQNTLLADFAREGAQVLGAATPAGTRLQDIGQFFEHVGHTMLQAAEQWRQAYSARRTTDG